MSGKTLPYKKWLDSSRRNGCWYTVGASIFGGPRAFNDFPKDVCLVGCPFDPGWRWPGWQVIIGIETHAQLKARQKLFSNSLTSSLGEEPNTHVSPFDAAFPGTLPNLNQNCVDIALRTAIALNCNIQPRSSFDRKHYFYSDLPTGYQITQHYAPIALNGYLCIPGRDSPIRIKQIQLEQDTAKSTFNPRTRTSSIDLNRAGAALVEIVTEPDLRSPEEAGAYGSLRCDVNVSVNPIGKPWGTRCEIKNLNSVKFMQAAIIHEIDRQRALLSADDGFVPQETRGFNQDTFETFALRSKEDAPDYRYMPDPNLGFLTITPERIEKTVHTMPELPWETRKRLLEAYKLSEQDVDVLFNLDIGGGAVTYFDRIRGLCSTGALLLMVHELVGRLHTSKLTFADNPISTAQLGELVDLVQNGSITGTSGKLLLRKMLAEPNEETTTERARALSLLVESSSDDETAALCAAAIAALPNEAAAYRKGHENVLNKILGRVMKESRGRADSKRVKECLISQLKEQ
ncbi:Glutamyl-tRNA amidotransferase subunit B, mitochondrial [Roridomyces roridus]|uniref:Glutamyl-tRNA(Gln) amidotransferase subunit B, mitochondrial n=1 Tax=Roridomyces roridus TaxID=1738132 RepID=A0AAD7FUP4_9AGAR|nr:Glutamyl-tRNA amidotransferase subunit B, mitochondrial [Roridomyces roridus]